MLFQDALDAARRVARKEGETMYVVLEPEEYEDWKHGYQYGGELALDTFWAGISEDRIIAVIDSSGKEEFKS